MKSHKLTNLFMVLLACVLRVQFAILLDVELYRKILCIDYIERPT